MDDLVWWIWCARRPGVLVGLFGLLLPPGVTGRLLAQTGGAAGDGVEMRLPADAETKGTALLRGGEKLSYTAHAGMLVVAGTDADDLEISAPNPETGAVRRPADSAVAAMSYVAYFADGVNERTRPIVFLYDGGPSVSTRTMLVASFGPIVAELPGLHGSAGGAFQFGNNVDSLLDVADLVFIDPPGTGYGRIAGRDAAHAFYGIDGDAAAFDRFIRRFLSRYARWESPRYLFGHSYGTVRNAVLARRLGENGVDLNGIVAVGLMLNLDDFPDAASGTPGTDSPYILQLPTFAATAWFHHKVASPTAEVEPWLRTVEDYAKGPYAAALMEGSDLPAAEEQAVAAQLERFTGVSAQTWRKAHLRLQAAEFAVLLLGDEGLVTGRQDTRYTAPAMHWLAVKPGYDASGVKGPTVQAVIDTYMHTVLHFGVGENYQQDADIPGHWDVFHVGDETKDWLGGWNMLPDLAAVLTRETGLRVLAMGGLYDLATPYQAGVFEMKHLPVAPQIQKNIEYMAFPTGHEPYLDADSRQTMHARVAQFIRETSRGR